MIYFPLYSAVMRASGTHAVKRGYQGLSSPAESDNPQRFILDRAAHPWYSIVEKRFVMWVAVS